MCQAGRPVVRSAGKEWIAIIGPGIMKILASGLTYVAL